MEELFILFPISPVVRKPRASIWRTWKLVLEAWRLATPHLRLQGTSRFRPRLLYYARQFLWHQVDHELKAPFGSLTPPSQQDILLSLPSTFWLFERYSVQLMSKPRCLGRWSWCRSLSSVGSIRFGCIVPLDSVSKSIVSESLFCWDWVVF